MEFGEDLINQNSSIYILSKTFIFYLSLSLHNNLYEIMQIDIIDLQDIKVH